MVVVKSFLSSKKYVLSILNLQMRRLLPACIILGLTFFVLGAVAVKSSWEVSIMLFIFGAFFFPGCFLFFSHTKKKVQKSNKNQNISYQYCRFFSEKFYTYSVDGDDSKVSGEFSYHVLNQVMETRDYFFLFVSNALVNVLPKADIVKGNADLLRAIFKKKLGRKYISKLKVS